LKNSPGGGVGCDQNDFTEGLRDWCSTRIELKREKTRERKEKKRGEEEKKRRRRRREDSF
jgi:hypothetical protein